MELVGEEPAAERIAARHAQAGVIAGLERGCPGADDGPAS
jgi:hypothetical protein